MKTLPKYLAEYVEIEMRRAIGCTDNTNLPDLELLQQWIKDGVDAYESTENCSVSVAGGDCPDCETSMELGETCLEDEDGKLVDVSLYQCPDCSYVVYY